MSVPTRTPCPTQKGCKRGYLVLHRKKLEPRVLPWQQYSRCHFVSFVMYISGAKFEDHCSNISGDILNLVFYRFSGTIHDVITFLTCIVQKKRISLKRKEIFQKGKRHSSLLWKAFQISRYYFLLHGHFNTKCRGNHAFLKVIHLFWKIYHACYIFSCHLPSKFGYCTFK